MKIEARTILPLLVAGAMLIGAVPARALEEPVAIAANRPQVVHVGGGNLQQMIDAAASYSIVMCDRNQPLTLSTPVTIRKPLTLEGLHARLPEKLGNTPLLIVAAEGVAITDFELHGNRDSVPQEERCALLVVRAGDFRIERGLFVNSSKDGIMIDGAAVKDRDLVGGVVRDIVGRGNVRDLVSVSGGGVHGHKIRNVLIDNVRGIDSRLRGAVEVSDGTDNVTVRKVYAEQMVYAIDVQDHGEEGQANTNVVVEDVYALDCRHAVRTANSPRGHANLTLRDITAERCEAPLALSNTANLTLENARVIDHGPKRPAISIANCDGVSVRDVTILNSAHKGPGLLVENCNDARIDGLALRGETGALTSAVCFRAGKDRTYSGLMIRNIFAPRIAPAGIVLERKGDKATLTDYRISGNLARVQDQIKGSRAVISDNATDGAE